MMKTITPAQCRGARGMLRWTSRRLAKAAAVSLPTITRFESEKVSPHAFTLKAIVDALEGGGARFLEGGEVGLKEGGRKLTGRQRLDNLEAALVEDILATPDDEFLAEIREDGGDPEAMAEEARKIFEEAKESSNAK